MIKKRKGKRDKDIKEYVMEVGLKWCWGRSWEGIFFVEVRFACRYLDACAIYIYRKERMLVDKDLVEAAESKWEAIRK